MDHPATPVRPTKNSEGDSASVLQAMPITQQVFVLYAHPFKMASSLMVFAPSVLAIRSLMEDQSVFAQLARLNLDLSASASARVMNSSIPREIATRAHSTKLSPMEDAYAGLVLRSIPVEFASSAVAAMSSCSKEDVPSAPSTPSLARSLTDASVLRASIRIRTEYVKNFNSSLLPVQMANTLTLTRAVSPVWHLVKAALRPKSVLPASKLDMSLIVLECARQSAVMD